ncbi:hypothetical protein EZV62_000034 [Acer yangbiense]|uniref:Pectinesterase inhibitor domain-containing protein n=1 Tax=Acer yangbiense TaxID=1000413 RepID=A0A5C7IQD2_9ROSI|nr:hypothetical protein EZV62_000034 [Acer yangbiense]
MVSFKRYFLQVSILGVLLFITPSNAASSKIINDICAKTRFPSICLEILESTPGAAAADVKGLGKITLDLARSTASKTLGQINSLLPKTTDPKLKEIYKTCSEHYDNAIGSFNNAETDLNNSNYFSMNSQASVAMTEAGDCDGETAKLAQQNDSAETDAEMELSKQIALCNTFKEQQQNYSTKTDAEFEHLCKVVKVSNIIVGYLMEGYCSVARKRSIVETLRSVLRSRSGKKDPQETLPENPGAASHPPDGKKDPQGAFTSRKITLKSSDGDEFVVDEEVALESQLLQFATEYDCAIELPYVTSKMLSKAMEYCKKHVESRTGAVDDDDLKAWDAEFVKVDQATLFDLIRAAHYLIIKSLSELTCKIFVDMCKGKTREELDEMLKLLMLASIVLVLLFMIMHMTPSFARLHVNKVSTKENQLINDICSKTTNPSNCLRLLKSISRTGTVDLKGIAKIILDLPLSNATKTLDLVNSLIPKTNDFRLKEGYLTCSEVYDNAIDEIKNAESDFIQGDYSSMNIQTI